MGLWSGIFKTDILGVESMCISEEDIPRCTAKNIYMEAYNTGRDIHSGLPPNDAVTFGMCKMIGELQQEVSDLKSQLNTIGKNI